MRESNLHIEEVPESISGAAVSMLPGSIGDDKPSVLTILQFLECQKELQGLKMKYGEEIMMAAKMIEDQRDVEIPPGIEPELSAFDILEEGIHPASEEAKKLVVEARESTDHPFKEGLDTLAEEALEGDDFVSFEEHEEKCNEYPASGER